MAKLPFMRWFPWDYLAVSRSLSLYDKGILFDLMNYLWVSDDRGRLPPTTLEQLARMVGCAPDAARASLRALSAQQLLTVAFKKNGTVKIESRRMRRDAERITENAARQRKFNNAHVTHESHANNGDVAKKVTDKNSEVRSQNDLLRKSSTTARAKPPALFDVRAYAESRGLAAADGDYFFKEMEAEGWQFAGQPIRSWKRLFLRWQEKKTLPSQQPAPAVPPARGAYVGGRKIA